MRDFIELRDYLERNKIYKNPQQVQKRANRLLRKITQLQERLALEEQKLMRLLRHTQKGAGVSVSLH